MNGAGFLAGVHHHIAAMSSDGDLGMPGFAWTANDKDELCIFALDLDSPQAWAVALAESTKPGVRHWAFGMDRFGRPNQGTTLGDLVAGLYIDRETEDWQFKPFAVEYTAKPEQRGLWFNWGNEFWNAVILCELRQLLKKRADIGSLQFTSVAIGPNGEASPRGQ